MGKNAKIPKKILTPQEKQKQYNTLKSEILDAIDTIQEKVDAAMGKALAKGWKKNKKVPKVNSTDPQEFTYQESAIAKSKKFAGEQPKKKREESDYIAIDTNGEAEIQRGTLKKQQTMKRLGANDNTASTTGKWKAGEFDADFVAAPGNVTKEDALEEIEKYKEHLSVLTTHLVRLNVATLLETLQDNGELLEPVLSILCGVKIPKDKKIGTYAATVIKALQKEYGNEKTQKNADLEIQMNEKDEKIEELEKQLAKTTTTTLEPPVNAVAPKEATPGTYTAKSFKGYKFNEVGKSEPLKVKIDDNDQQDLSIDIDATTAQQAAGIAIEGAKITVDGRFLKITSETEGINSKVKIDESSGPNVKALFGNGDGETIDGTDEIVGTGESTTTADVEIGGGGMYRRATMFKPAMRPPRHVVERSPLFANIHKNNRTLYRL